MGVVLWLTEPGRLGKATSGGTFVWKAALMVMVEPSGPVGSDSLGSQPQGSSCPFCCRDRNCGSLPRALRQKDSLAEAVSLSGCQKVSVGGPL